MKLNTKALRYLSSEDWRVLTSVEAGSRNHEVVPTTLISQLSGVRNGTERCISTLAKADLVAKVKNAKYDGYRLTYGGLDYLALHSHQKADIVYSVGNQIGVGKESDIFVVANTKGEQLVLKIHRLGRISFRTVKNNRDYLRKRSSATWMYMSRLAAMKEFTFMKALADSGIPVPQPIAQNRHQIIMSLIDGFPLRQISNVPDPAGLYGELMEMILRLARLGLIHGDFNELNILIKEEEVQPSKNSTSTPPEEPEIRLVPVLIDFPQMVSIDHANARYYFERDVNCVKRFFDRRFHFTSDEAGPFFEDAKAQVGKDGVKRLDVEAEASGFSKKMSKELEAYMKAHGVDGDAEGGAQAGGGSPDGENGLHEDDAEEEEDPTEDENKDEDEGEVGNTDQRDVDGWKHHEQQKDTVKMALAEKEKVKKNSGFSI